MKFYDIGQNKNIYADGIHDDTKAIQACLDKMKDGGTVFFPDGTYLISAALIFYSGQWLKFSDNAVLLRSKDSNPVTKYMLASYSEGDWCGYGGTHDAVITGGIFDGNAELNENLTIINTVHSKNIVIRGCRFLHCSNWHCIEINSTDTAQIVDCVFEGETYTSIREDLTSELLQIDAANHGAYGPVYNCDGKHIAHAVDDTPCRNISVDSCIFKCDGFPGIGHHGDAGHENIRIVNNVFTGASGKFGKSRGYITFTPKVSGVNVVNNAFISPAEKGINNIGIIANNPDKKSMIAENNTFIGNFSEYFKGGITVKDSNEY
ncbi:MAG: glycosyl hydrolase family 28-related protein [Oscillospiraceae bacterium]|nr:glycosyl hydrolase family 28-related protein [Oscillospiraceae bacterium]